MFYTYTSACMKHAALFLSNSLTTRYMHLCAEYCTHHDIPRTIGQPAWIHNAVREGRSCYAHQTGQMAVLLSLLSPHFGDSSGTNLTISRSFFLDATPSGGLEPGPADWEWDSGANSSSSESWFSLVLASVPCDCEDLPSGTPLSTPSVFFAL